ncbi:uncharacterized [Tachysurus ichikawai]
MLNNELCWNYGVLATGLWGIPGPGSGPCGSRVDWGGWDGHKHTGFTIPQLFDPRDQTGDYEQQLSFRPQRIHRSRIIFLPLPSSTSKTPALSGSVCNASAEVTLCYSSVRKRWPLFEIPIKFKLTSCVPMWNGRSGAATQTLEEDV